LAQGAPAARMKVAGLLDRGEPGVGQNRARALPLFQEAAKVGDPEAIYMIGLYLQRGYVVPKDDDAASQWFLRAAEIGEAKAQRKLAMRYFRGTGVEQDTVEALKWCELALKNPNGDVETKNLAREYQESISSTVTPRKVSQAMREVGRFKLKEFKGIILPPLPYDGPALVYHELSDTNGNKLEAAVIALQGDKVILERRGDGTRFTVPLKRLSDESKKLVQQPAE
ncbi:MAG: tetratricopeptide repeat protein, partial [Verrucomicrobiales bacterium]